MRGETCHNCGKEAKKIIGNYRLSEIGLPVVLQGVQLVRCEECGTTEPIIPDLNGLMRVVAFAVLAHPCRLSGTEIKFLRKYLGIQADEFARLVRVDPSTLSKWENNAQKIGKNSDRLIRFVVMGKSPGLRNEMEEFMKRYAELKDCDPPRKPQLKVDPATLEYEYA